MTQIADITSRLAALREEMRRENLFAAIFPSADPHLSEYVPPRWKGREWVSGFDGSAGTAVVTLDSAALWTDSRYFIAAARQLEGTGYTLMRERVDGTPSIAEWLQSQHSGGCATEVAVDGMCVSAAEAAELREALRNHGGMTLRTNIDLLQRVWRDRPPLPLGKVRRHPLQYAGETCASKLARLRRELLRRGASAMLVTQLDDIAWTLNLRGSDVHCTPVFVAWLMVEEDRATLFIDSRKLTPETVACLEEEGVSVDEYDGVTEALRHYAGYSLLVDPATVNCTLAQVKGIRRQYKVVSAPSPIPMMKAVKNEAEREGFRRAMERDGVAMVKLLRWLDECECKEGLTELAVSRRLHDLRAEQPHFVDDSFDTIAAYGEHGAIVHYEPTPESDMPLASRGLLLLDSGAQYEDGTTDITRTIALGPLSEEQCRVYTLVLKGHLQLQNLCFPSGASGTQLDAVARMALWREGLNYMHGTGHGVGSCLSVHEGPHQIRQEYRPAPIVEGMTVTDEPGIYVEGSFGVRIENTLLAVHHDTTRFGSFLRFEPLTLCPIDRRPIVAGLLSPEERAWLDGYHGMVYERLSVLLDDEADLEWLRRNTLPL